MNATEKVVVGCYLQLDKHPRQNGKTLPCERLMDKNEQLCELVRDMWFWGYEGHMDSESKEWQMKHIDGVLDRMHELGVVE